MYENLNPFELVKEEMTHDEVTVRVNAVHRLRTVVTVMGNDSFKTQILPYFEGTYIISINGFSLFQLLSKRKTMKCCMHLQMSLEKSGWFI